MEVEFTVYISTYDAEGQVICAVAYGCNRIPTKAELQSVLWLVSGDAEWCVITVHNEYGHIVAAYEGTKP